MAEVGPSQTSQTSSHATSSPSPTGADAYRRHWGAIYRFVYGRVQNREEAEDLTQEVCARVLGRRGTAEPTLAYLRAAALNLIRDRWRRRRSTGTLSPLEEAWLVADDDADPSRRHLDRLWLTGLLERLPRDQRLVVELRVIQGLSRAETAARMGRSEASIRGLQYRAIQALRAMALGREPAEPAEEEPASAGTPGPAGTPAAAQLHPRPTTGTPTGTTSKEAERT